MGTAEGGFISHMMFYFRIFIQLAPSIFSKYLRVSIIKKISRRFIMSFSSAVRRSGIPSVLVCFLDLLQGHFFFFPQNARNVCALLWCGWRR